jgi:diguanylate cyclase (GGDEF)-like protein
VKVRVAQPEILGRTIMRRKQIDKVRQGINLGLVLEEIISWANRFVPSESGSILLDDPMLKMDPHRKGRLYFAACFGPKSGDLVGSYIAADQGIAGRTYKSGAPYISTDVSKDSTFHKRIARRISHEAHSIICCPIAINHAVIGVIELINRKGRADYDARDLGLLEVFAGYTATLMENSLAAREFEDLSKVDNLTGLYNDRYFFRRLEDEMASVRDGSCEGDTSLIFFDLDRFKEVNDTRGHLAGSRVLQEVGKLLRRIFHGTSAVLARYGGDEYVVLLPGVALPEARHYAERIRETIATFTFLHRRGPRGEPAYRIKGLITASVGVASQSGCVMPHADAAVMAEHLLKASDDAMYRAKALGKNRVHAPGDRPS